jgi:hypothetical protein
VQAFVIFVCLGHLCPICSLLLLRSLEGSVSTGSPFLFIFLSSSALEIPGNSQVSYFVWDPPPAPSETALVMQVTNWIEAWKSMASLQGILQPLGHS